MTAFDEVDLVLQFGKIVSFLLVMTLMRKIACTMVILNFLLAHIQSLPPHLYPLVQLCLSQRSTTYLLTRRLHFLRTAFPKFSLLLFSANVQKVKTGGAFLLLVFSSMHGLCTAHMG